MQSILVLFLLLSVSSFARTHQTQMEELPFNESAVREDLKRILQAAELPESYIDFKINDASDSKIKSVCKGDSILLEIQSPPFEKTSSVYKGLRELGFLFPHPLLQISPSVSELRKKCQKSWTWKPALKFRGFHLHTLHPSEWISGFFQNQGHVAEATVRWLARNQQNIFDLSLLRIPLTEIKKQMRPHFMMAQSLQIYTGVSLGIAFHQQNSYKLLSLWETFFGGESKETIKKRLEELMEALPLSYLVLEKGTSEFTPTDFEKTITWLNHSAEVIRKNKKAHFTKVHVSSNQVSAKWGNYNFLPQFGKSSVGILPHTVMFYGLVDEKAPMYGNKNFHSIRDFMLKEKSRRPTWYYPETSYWVGMDVDVPLFLTDYFRTRTEDMKFLFENGIEGQLNFTTGHVLGYWLYDWNLALVNDLDYQFDPYTALSLLGEAKDKWELIFNYQKKWYKDKGLISLLSSANLQDELSSTHRIHDRNTMKDLTKNSSALKQEISLLEQSLKDFPEIDFIKHKEIRNLLSINKLRQLHALSIRLALSRPEQKQDHLDKARSYREKAQALIQELSQLSTNYPELPLFKQWKNPTSYQFGYAYPAASLYFWEREESQIRNDSYFPFWGNMYDVLDIVF